MGVKVMKNMKAAKWTVYKSAVNFTAGENMIKKKKERKK